MVEADSNQGAVKSTVKFLCSYGGKILPRPTDGKLRYFGGETRVISVDRSISFSELLIKLGELCGTSVSLRCQLPYEDLDALVSITSDEDLENLIEEYEQSSQSKIRAFLSPPKSIKTVSPPSSATSSSATVGSWVWSQQGLVSNGCVHQPLRNPVCYERSAGSISKPCYYACHPPHQRNPSPIHFFHKRTKGITDKNINSKIKI